MVLHRRTVLSLALAGGLSACQQPAPPSKPVWPEAILPDLAWSLAEPLASSPAALLTALQAYAKDVHTHIDPAELQTPFPAQALDIRFHYYEQAASGDWRELSQDLKIRSPHAPSYLEILYALHQAAYPYLRNQDHHFFEGLWLQKTRLEPGVAMYLLHTGS